MIRGVPYDHQLEYIESTGTQYVLTDILPEGVTHIECTYMTVGNPSYDWWGVFGAEIYSGGWKNFHLRWEAAGQEHMRVGGSGEVISPYKNTKVNFQLNLANNLMTATFNDYQGQSSYVASDVALISMPIALFGMNSTSGVSKKGKCRIYGFLAESHGSRICDLIPVSVNGVAMMYDRVTGTFPKHYGTFVAGPVASTPLMGVHMYGKSDYWFWPKKLIPMPGGNPTKIMNLDQDPGLGVWAYRIATNGYAGGEIPSSSIFSFTDKSVSCENLGGYAVCVCRKFEPGTYMMTAYRDIIGHIYALEYTPSGTGHVISGNKMTVISGNNAAGRFVGRFTVSQGAITVLMFGSAQRGYQVDPGPCTFTDVHINDYIE